MKSKCVEVSKLIVASKVKMETPLKILVCGDVCGKFNVLYGRVRNVLKKNKDFEMLLCVGSFFGTNEESKKEWEAYSSGSVAVPIPTYILGPTEKEEVNYFASVSLDSGGEMCENVTYLGRKGILKTQSGLQIAYLSGVEKTEAPEEGCHFTQSDIEALEYQCNEESFKGVDILMTSCWPKGVSQFANQPDGIDCDNCGSVLVSHLAEHMKPRYHFAGHEGVHYERPPYRNHQVLRETAQHVTRFISLAHVGNTAKKKYMYAFNIVPMVSMDKDELVKQPPDVTEFPYRKVLGGNDVSMTKSEMQQDAASTQNFFFDTQNATRSQGPRSKRQAGEGGGPKKQRKGPPPLKGSCWFCLGSPQVEKHLVVSVGDDSYVALAKGGLVPDHVLICPIGHFESTVKLSEDVLMEIEKYKRALRRLFHSEGKSCVIFERNFYTQHLQLQVVPVPQTEVDELKDIFKEHGDQNSLPIRDVPANTELKQFVPVGAPYFVAEFDNGERLLHRVTHKMPLQFGREVVASPSLLNMPDRVDWKACKVSLEEEKKMAAEFRKKFQPFDFNLT
ncbi:CWF19-like protein 1 isoform X3 [Porites lutea]|uniref:CWF19-like protein 1 isoform X3 n=1 Tax=Porites lutea TaxID=51062 RepID=UPI003CC51199